MEFIKILNPTLSNMNVFDAKQVRALFPILKEKVHGKPLVYLDSAASSQKPQSVIDAERFYYEQINSNIHRGVHLLSEKATQAYEGARSKVKDFIHAKSEKEIIFVRGTTEGINLIASSFGKKFIEEGDEIIISAMEHHSNIVPWQMLCEERKAVLKVIDMNEQGELKMDSFAKLLTSKTKLISIVHISNSLGTINPIREVIAQAHARNIPVVIDGAQAIHHVPINVQELDCDFYVFSGHKMYGPTGVGIVYGKENWLDQMPPYQGGGDMIRSVRFTKTTYNDLPYKFEAGTPNIAGGIALGAAVDFISSIGIESLAVYEHELLNYATEKISEIEQVKLIGTAKNKSSVVSFTTGDIHPHDIGTILDREGVAIRTGHHCTQPVMEFFGIPATSRVSLACYNTKEEIDVCVFALKKAIKMFS